MTVKSCTSISFTNEIRLNIQYMIFSIVYFDIHSGESHTFLRSLPENLETPNRPITSLVSLFSSPLTKNETRPDQKIEALY